MTLSELLPIRQGVSLLLEEGPASFLDHVWNHLVYLWRERVVPAVDIAINVVSPLGMMLTPLFGLAFGKLILKTRKQYVRYTPFHTNVFGKSRFHIPELRRYYFINDEVVERFRQQYFSHEEVCIEPGDTILEVGPAIGITTQLAANQGDQVIALEANPRNLRCLKRNVTEPHVSIHNLAVGAESGELEVEHGLYRNSLLSDELHGEKQGKTDINTVQIERIDTLLDRLEIERVDFLKINTGGGETAIIKGIGDANIANVVLSCPETRDGEPVLEPVSEALSNLGYDILDYDGCVYATKDTY